MLESLFNLFSRQLTDPTDAVAAGKRHRFIAQVSAIAVAAKYSYAGLRCPNSVQYGMVIKGIEVVNLQATAEVFSVYTGVNIAPSTPGTLQPGVRRRDRGLNSDGTVISSSILAWIAQSSSFEGNRINRVSLLGNESRHLPLNWFVGRGEDIYVVTETQNRLVSAVFHGEAFDSAQTRDAYLARMG